MKRIVILVVLICSIYFTKSIVIANERTTNSSVKIEQVKKPQKKNCCKDVKVGQKCPVCGKVKKACPANCKKACCVKQCCKNVKVGEKCKKCGKIKEACPPNCKKACCVKQCCKNVKVGQKCPKCGMVKEAECCKNIKVGQKCPKCGKVKKAKHKAKCNIEKMKDKTPPPPPPTKQKH